jgi:HEPN domain-containing protein
MAPDPGLVSETKSWFLKVAADLRAAECDLATTPPLLEDAAFHCQQAAEKALKGFLTWHSAPFRRTHSIEEIGEQCLGIDRSLSAVVDPAVPLTEYAWAFRYPGEPEEPTREEADEALSLAKAVYEAVLERLPEEVRP